MARKTIIIIAGAIFFLSLIGYSAGIYLRQFNFNDAGALDKWAKMIFNGPVEYRLMRYGEQGFVKALSRRACSALYYRIGFKPQDYPVISWKWQVLKFPDKKNALTAKEKDDFAARLYVIFPFLSFSSSRFIEYIWDENLPVETMLDSPSGKNIKQIVVRSGQIKDGAWASETRNIYEDYRKAFGKAPRHNVGAVAIMCDADNTNSESESGFDEIAIASLTGERRRLSRR